MINVIYHSAGDDPGLCVTPVDQKSRMTTISVISQDRDTSLRQDGGVDSNGDVTRIRRIVDDQSGIDKQYSNQIHQGNSNEDNNNDDVSQLQRIVISQFYLSIAPLINSLRIFGLFFEPATSLHSHYSSQHVPYVHIHHLNEKVTARSHSKETINAERPDPLRGRFGRFYSWTILIILWANVIRNLSTFSSNDKLNSDLFMTVVQYLWVVICTGMHTAYFFANRSGKLQMILDELALRINHTYYHHRIDKDQADHAIHHDKHVYGSETCDHQSPVTPVDNNALALIDLERGDITIYEKNDGRLKVKNDFHQPPVLTAPTVDYPNKLIGSRARLFTILSWIIIVANCTFGCYLLFATKVMNPSLAPLTSYLPVENLLPARAVYFLVFIVLSGDWILIPATTLLIELSLWVEFRTINQEFKARLEMDGDCTSGKGARFANGDAVALEQVRIRHHKLARLVERADKCLCLGKGTLVVGHIGIVALLLYVCIFYPAFVATPFLKVTGTFWVLAASSELAIAATGAVLVHNAAHRMIHYIHDLDLDASSTHMIGQVNVFIKRLGGEPIGFTVLRLFVIDRNTILSIFGMLITYFLLFIQVTPVATGVAETSMPGNGTTAATWPA